MVSRVGGTSSRPVSQNGGDSSEKSTVKRGESLSQFAKRNSVSEDDLKAANPGIDLAKIKAGMELNLPEQKQTTTEQKPAGYSAESSSAKKAEHSFDGDARAATLHSSLSSSPAPGGSGAPSGTGAPAGGGTPAGTGAPTGSGSPATGGTPSGGAATEATTMKQGSKGEEVEDLQGQLNTVRSGEGKKEIEVDGKYGKDTAKAVKEFQKDSGLHADGEAGSRTQDRLKLESDPSFKSLGADSKQKVRDLMGKYSTEKVGKKDTGENRDSRANLLSVATDPNFAKLSPEGQQKALDRLAANPTDAASTKGIQDTVKSRSELENNANFKKLNEDTRKQALTKLEDYHGQPAQQKNLSALVNNPSFSQLSRTHQDQAIKTLDKYPASEPFTKNLMDITGSPNFRNMDDASKTRVLNMAAGKASSLMHSTDLKNLVNHAEFGKLSNADKNKALNVFESTTPTGRQALQKLFDRTIDGKPAITLKGYGNTGTTLDQMNRLATTPLDSRLTQQNGAAVDKKKVTEQLLQELSNPDLEVNQGNRGTCTVTSATHALVSKNPAEYARLVTDLSTTGRSKLANGDTINVPSQDAWQQDNGTRSHGERLLQSALMDYARPGKGYQNWNAGPDGTRGTPDDGFVDPTNPNNRSMDGYPDRSASGLVPDELKRVLSGIHGKKFEVYTGSFNFRDDQKDMMEKVKSQLKDGKVPTHIDITWGAGGMHALEVTEVRGGRVYFRNPWGGGNIGPTGSVNGTAQNNTGAGPTRKVEDGNRGLESMTEADFQKHVGRVFVQ